MTDRELLSAFDACRLRHEDWTHRAHVRVAFLILKAHGLSGGIRRLRTGIRRLNAALGIPDEPNRGYHETVTVAFARLVDGCMRASHDAPHASSDAFCEAHPGLLDKGALSAYYSAARLADPASKAAFVEPDLAPLPEA